MAYQVLARKYRPQLFSDVIGQDHVTRTLLNALAQNRIAHGYIFSGHRGIGKTTIARILAAALNCSTPVGTPDRPTEEPCRICVNCREISSASRQETSVFEEAHSFDVEEIDAATNRGIDDARLLTAKIQTRPTNKSKYRIIILDEAHQITDAAWNALLKTLEEPPEWAVFMFATTQPEDIPQTIRSRCQHFSFHAVKLDDIVGQLRRIADKEAILVDDATLTLLAEAGDGSMRDALSIMDQAIASAPLIEGNPSSEDLDNTPQNPGAPGPDFRTRDRSTTGARPHLELTQVRELMGSVSNVVYEQILEAVHANNSADVLAIVGRLLDAGNGAPQLARQFVRYLRNVIVAKITNLAPDTDATGTAADLLQISPEERNRAARSAVLFTEEELSRFLSIVLRTFDELGYRQEQRFHLELGLLKLVHVQRLVPIEELLSQLGAKPPSAPKTTPSTTPIPSSKPVTPSPASSASPSASPASSTSSARPASSASSASPNSSASSALSAKNAVILSGAEAQFHRASAQSKDPDDAIPAQTIQDISTTQPGAPFTTASSSWMGSASETQDHPIQTQPGAPGPDSRTRDRATTPSSAPTSPSSPSPFETDRTRKVPAASHGINISAASTNGSLALAQAPDATSQPETLPAQQNTRPHLVATDAAPQPHAPIHAAPIHTADITAESITAPAEAHNLDLTALHQTLIAALSAVKGQQSASEQLEESTLALDGNTLEIRTTLSKTMLPVVLNAEAERLLKSALRSAGTGTLTLKLLPGAPTPSTAVKKPRQAASGSAAELAEKHPMVQQARQLFSADISNIIDLRDK